MQPPALARFSHAVWQGNRRRQRR